MAMSVMMKVARWEDLTQEERDLNAIGRALEENVIAVMKATTPHPEVAFNAADNTLVYVIICDHPHDCARMAADAVVKGVLLNGRDGTQLQ
jgi:hypothetical protein